MIGPAAFIGVIKIGAVTSHQDNIVSHSAPPQIMTVLSQFIFSPEKTSDWREEGGREGGRRGEREGRV